MNSSALENQEIRPSEGGPLWHDLRPWLEKRFGRPMRRVALDAGSTCPNRDGSKGRGGCIYCDVEGSGTGALHSGQDLARQLALGLERVRKNQPDARAIAYFQSYSNTYVTPERLDEVLAVVEPELGRGIQCVSLATRPDTLPDWAIQRLVRLQERVPVWIELGLECANDQVLLEIQRLHSLADFEDAARRVHAAGLELVAHAILGLPGDGREGARATARAIARSGAMGVKVHHLMVLERTVLAHRWRAGGVAVLELEQYVEWLADFVESLAPEQVLHRLTGDAQAPELLAPLWTRNKSGVRLGLERLLRQRGSRQGSMP